MGSDPNMAFSSSQPTTCNVCGSILSQVGSNFSAYPEGVKFEPTDEQLMKHLAAKLSIDGQCPHPDLEKFIPTLLYEDGMCGTHPDLLPGSKRDGVTRYYFHRPARAYTTGTRKRRKVQIEEDGEVKETRWHKTGKTRPVFVEKKQVGCKKILVMYSTSSKKWGGGLREKDLKTNWVIHQYHWGKESAERDGEWVVSKVFWQIQPRAAKRPGGGEAEAEAEEEGEGGDMVAAEVNLACAETISGHTMEGNACAEAGSRRRRGAKAAKEVDLQVSAETGQAEQVGEPVRGGGQIPGFRNHAGSVSQAVLGGNCALGQAGVPEMVPEFLLLMSQELQVGSQAYSSQGATFADGVLCTPVEETVAGGVQEAEGKAEEKELDAEREGGGRKAEDITLSQISVGLRLSQPLPLHMIGSQEFSQIFENLPPLSQVLASESPRTAKEEPLRELEEERGGILDIDTEAPATEEGQTAKDSVEALQDGVQRFLLPCRKALDTEERSNRERSKAGRKTKAEKDLGKTRRQPDRGAKSITRYFS